MSDTSRQWETGQTAASITFVGDATTHLQSSSCDAADRALLEDVIDRIKRGDLILQKFMTPQDYLADPDKALETATEQDPFDDPSTVITS